MTRKWFLEDTLERQEHVSLAFSSPLKCVTFRSWLSPIRSPRFPPRSRAVRSSRWCHSHGDIPNLSARGKPLSQAEHRSTATWPMRPGNTTGLAVAMRQWKAFKLHGHFYESLGCQPRCHMLPFPFPASCSFCGSNHQLVCRVNNLWHHFSKICLSLEYVQTAGSETVFMPSGPLCHSPNRRSCGMLGKMGYAPVKHGKIHHFQGNPMDCHGFFYGYWRHMLSHGPRPGHQTCRIGPRSRPLSQLPNFPGAPPGSP